MTPPTDRARRDAGRGGSDSAQELVDRLSADPDALREYIAKRDDEVKDLRSRNDALERFRDLAIDVAIAVKKAGERTVQACV